MKEILKTTALFKDADDLLGEIRGEGCKSRHGSSPYT